MHVVATGVHDAVHGAGVVESGLLVDRKRIHVGPQHHRRAIAVPQHAHDAGAPDAGGHLDAERTSGVPPPAPRCAPPAWKLGMPVEILVERLDVVEHAVDIPAQFGSWSGRHDCSPLNPISRAARGGVPRGASDEDATASRLFLPREVCHMRGDQATPTGSGRPPCFRLVSGLVRRADVVIPWRRPAAERAVSWRS